MGVFGALALGHFGLERTIGLGQFGGSFLDPQFQLIALLLEVRFGLLEGIFGALALDSVTDGPRRLAPIRLAFDQVILDSVAHSFQADGFILDAGQHHNGQTGRVRACAKKRLRAGAIGQREIQQEQIELVLTQVLDGLGPGLGVSELELAEAQFAQGFLQQDGVGGAVFDQEDLHRGYVCDGGCALPWLRRGGVRAGCERELILRVSCVFR